MSSWKKLCAVGITFSLIITMAFLPLLLGHVEDRHFLDTPQYAEIIPVELKIDNSTMHRLFLLSSPNNRHEIGTEQAILTVEELEEFVVEGLKPYFESGLLPFSDGFTFDPQAAKPILVYDAKSHEVESSVFWVVVVEIVDQGSIELVVDDCTGKILILSYSTMEYFRKISFSPEDALRLYMDIYLRGLGVDDLYTELLSFDQNDSLNHLGILLRHSEFSGYVILSFLTDEYGLNMQIQSEIEDEVVKGK